jgi:orotidine-5'-phosphate decarboxylase
LKPPSDTPSAPISEKPKVTEKRIIVPLDFPQERSALEMADKLDPSLCRVKVGKELFTAAGPHVVRELNARNFEVFLDLKFHDIPNTVAGACRSAARLRIWMLNVHASGGEAMLLAARKAIDEESHRPLLIGVTILTSLSEADIHAIGFSGTVLENVERLALLTQAAGLDGVVCSAAEAPGLRKIVAPSFKLVTPGIRLPGDDNGDQARVVTPADAMAMGSDYLVIGRSITRAEDPVAALKQIQAQIKSYQK